MTTQRQYNPLLLLALASDPAIEPEGSVYYNTTTDKIRQSDGAVWSDTASSSGSTQRTFAFFAGA